jgi:hypothetical protein
MHHCLPQLLVAVVNRALYLGISADVILEKNMKRGREWRENVKEKGRKGKRKWEIKE